MRAKPRRAVTRCAVTWHWTRSVLQQDQRQRDAGLDDEEFDALGEQLHAQRAECARWLAQGKAQPVFPALHTFLHLCGLNFMPSPQEASRVSRSFLRAMVETPSVERFRTDRFTGVG